MFKIALSPTFWIKVSTGAIGEDGKKVTGEFEIKCKRLTVPEIKQLSESSQSSDFPDAAFLRGIVVDWRGVGAEDGTTMPFNEETFDAAMSAGFAGDMVGAFYRSMPGAKSKN